MFTKSQILEAIAHAGWDVNTPISDWPIDAVSALAGCLPDAEAYLQFGPDED